MMNIYRDEDGWMALTERQADGKHTKEQAQLGCLEEWVEVVHGDDAYKGDILKKRIIHAIHAH